MKTNSQTASPVISVIVPVYNVAPYLPRCLDSITGQTYQNLEIILVDDGSTDNSLEICQQYAAKDTRIIVIHQENKGVSAARNTGLDNACGEFITFADPDDSLTPDACEKLLLVQQKTSADMVTGNFYYASPGVAAFKAIPPQHFTSLHLNLHDILSISIQFHCFIWGKLYRRSALANLRFNPTYKLGEDVDFLFRTLGTIQSFAYLPEPVYYYYLRPHSAICTHSVPCRISNLDIWKGVISFCEKQGFQDLYEKILVFIVDSSVWLIVTILLYDSKNEYTSQLLAARSYLVHHWTIVQHSPRRLTAKIFLALFVCMPLVTRFCCRLPGIRLFLQKNFDQSAIRRKGPRSSY